jgi:hypothetical protein
MSTTKSFNLLPYVHQKMLLTARSALIIVFIFIFVLLMIYGFEARQYSKLDDQVVLLDKSIRESTQSLQQYLLAQHKGGLVAVLPDSLSRESSGFYDEFQALSDIKIENLWLTQVTINRSQPLVRFKGEMTTADKFQQFSLFLSQNAIFRDTDFKGVQVEKSNLPTVSSASGKKMQAPKLFNFIAETRPIKRHAYE